MKRGLSADLDVVLYAAERGHVMRRETCPDVQYWLLLRGEWTESQEGKGMRVTGAEMTVHLPVRPCLREARGPTLGLAVRVIGGGSGRSDWDTRRTLWRIAREFVVGASDDLALAEAAAELREPVVPRPTGDVPKWLRRMRRRLREDDETDLATLAREADVTPAHASAAFARAFGVPPSIYRRRRRLHEAARGMSDRPLATAALEAGFYDRSHLDRACRSELGITAAELRDLVRSGS